MVTSLQAAPRTWPLVGRDELLEQAVGLLRRRAGAGLVLQGGEGVGKSRFAAEVAARVRASGGVVVHAVATTAAASMPFGALAEVLPAQTSSAVSPFDLMRLAAARLRAMAPAAGLVLVVDDAHLLDDASAALVAHAVRSGAARALLVVRQLHPAPDALLGLLKDGPCVPLRIEPLVGAELRSLCSQVLGAPVEGSTLRRLEELSAGNLLFLHELLEAGLADGSLREEQGLWRSTGGRVSTPQLTMMVAGRLSRFADDERAVVELTALAGTVELAVLERLHPSSAVAAAERAGLLEVAEDGRRLRVRLTHPLYAAVLRDSTPRLTARLHRRRLALALDEVGCRRRDDGLRIVLQRLEAGDVPSEELLLSAARSAAERFDVRLAVRCTAAAVELSGSAAARLASAKALYAAGAAERAEELLLDLHAAAPTPQARGEITLVRASNLLSGFGRAAQAEELVRSARAEVDDGELRDELTALGGLLALTRGRSQQALAEVEPVLARSGPPRASTVRALLVAMSAWGQVGRADTAVGVGDQLRAEAPDRGSPTVMEVVLVGLCYAYGALGRLDEAEALARDRYAAALDQRAPDLRSLWALALGQAALARGDLAAADGPLREAALLLRQDQSVLGVYSLAWCLGCLAEVLATGGDAAGARAVLDEADAVTPEPCFIASREQARIWVSWAERSSGVAAGIAVAVARGAQERGLLVPEAVALHQAARLGHAEDVVDRLAALTDLVDGELVPAHAAHARAVAEADADLLLAASRTYEVLGVRLDAAEAAAQAAGAFARTGRAQHATAAAQRSAALARQCPGARTPGLLLAVGPQALTAREQEVAGLAARGWTTAQIAEALVVSVRTVDNHLHRAYGKLGVSSRQELSGLRTWTTDGRPVGG